MSQGVDGLTIETLRSSRDKWWDRQYTRTLLDGIPTDARTLVEIGCGLARAAGELLPHRTELRYLGIDVDQKRLTEAHRELIASSHASRAQLLRATGARLPLADGTVDVVLTAMTLQIVADPRVVVHEARRVLCAHGVLVAIEPDSLAQRFYFDRSLEKITSAVAALYADRRAARLPADIAIGPKIPSVVRDAGFHEVTLRVECVQGGGYRRAQDVAAELLDMVDILAALAQTPCTDLAQDCKTAVARWLQEVGPDAMGEHKWFVPVFVTLGRL